MTAPISLYRTGLFGKCPACGKGDIYAGILDLRKCCNHCDFPIAKHDCGDGAIYFAMLIVSIIVVLLAYIIDITLQPALWLHSVIWTPIIILGSVGLLRIFKAYFIAIQYHTRKDDFS